MTTERFCDHCGRHIGKDEPYMTVQGLWLNTAIKYGIDNGPEDMPESTLCEECGEALQDQLNARPKINGDEI